MEFSAPGVRNDSARTLACQNSASLIVASRGSEFFFESVLIDKVAESDEVAIGARSKHGRGAKVWHRCLEGVDSGCK